MQGLTCTRRAALRLLATAAGGVFVAACSPTTPQFTPPGPATAQSASAAQPAQATTPQTTPRQGATPATPRSGGTLRIGIPGDILSLDGHARTPGTAESSWLIFDRLTTYDTKLTPMPMLAESWDISPDYTQFKFDLRKGVTWHSGREFTSDDVKWNLLRVRDPKVGSGAFVQRSNWFQTIDTPDKNTVVLISDRPRPSIFDLWENLNMIDREVMEGPDSKSKAVGTGPFSLVEWVQGDHIALAKNPNYWQSSRPYLDGITAYVREPQVELTQLESGSLDVVRDPAVREIARLRTDPTFTIVSHPNPGTILELGINLTMPPFDNKLVRQALDYAIDRKRFVEEIYLGTNVTQALPWSPSSPAYDAVKNGSYAFDLDRARMLLQQANVSTLQTEILVIGGGYPQLELFMQVYQADLAQIGVQATVKPLEGAAWVDAVSNHRFNAMYAVGDNSMNVYPATPLSGGVGWKPAPNNTGLNDPRWTMLVDDVSSEVDPAKQQALYTQINDYILDMCFSIPIASNPISFVTRSVVHDMTPTLHQAYTFTETWLDS
jgi:peptide/nickel transport system substrate-binding protein